MKDLIDKVKSSGKTIAGGTLISILLFTMNYVDKKTDALAMVLNTKEKSIMRDVDIRHSEVKESLKEIKQTLIKIDERLYKMQGDKY